MSMRSPGSVCSTCGRPRGVAAQRGSWELDIRPQIVPRTGNPSDAPAQISNDLICRASILRNGGTGPSTHLCDACLSIALRAIKAHIAELLSELDADHDKDQSLAQLTARLGLQQLRHHNACYDHNRMQDRLRELLDTREVQAADSEVLRMARWEASRPPLDGGPS